MKIAGIITEYNPFHNGHKYHIEQTRELTNCDLLIAIMSPNIVQRGEFAIIDKYRRTKEALNNGVDIVIELPSIFVLQSANKFAYGALKLLNIANINYLVFGSESNDLEYLNKLASVNINLDYIKEIMKTGVSYPSALGRLTNQLYPNDILAVAYLKELNKYPNIQAISLQRTNSYHSTLINSEIVSASAIRKALLNNEPFNCTTSMTTELAKYHNFTSNYFDIIKYSLLSNDSNELKQYLLVDEGIENHLIKQIKDSNSYDEFVDKCTNKRYTKTKIQRTLLNILLKNKKVDQATLEDTTNLRVLGFNKKGQSYLKELTSYSTNFAQLPKQQRDFEYKIAQLYQLHYQDKSIVKQEISGPITII